MHHGVNKSLRIQLVNYLLVASKTCKQVEKGMKKNPQSIAFRLDEEYRDRLEKLAEENRVSPGQFARMIVISALEDSERLALRRDLEEMKSAVANLRRDLKNVALALLVGAGKNTAEQANKWAKTHLRS